MTRGEHTPGIVERLRGAIGSLSKWGRPDPVFTEAADLISELVGALEKLATKADACAPKYEDHPGDLQSAVNEAYALAAKARGGAE